MKARGDNDRSGYSGKNRYHDTVMWRTLLIALVAIVATCGFISICSNPMIASVKPSLQPFSIDASLRSHRAGCRRHRSITYLRTAGAIDYTDVLRYSPGVPLFDPPMSVAYEPDVIDPDIADTAIEQRISKGISRAPDHVRSVLNDLVRITDYDFGKFKSLGLRGGSVQDIKGLHIPAVWGTRFEPHAWSRGAAERLGEAVRRFTDIHVHVDSHVFLDTDRIHEYPELFMTTEFLFDLTPLEIENVQRYIASGGFIITDNTRPQLPFSPEEAFFRKCVHDVIGSRGRMAPIPNDHPPYHSFFYFENGPPIGQEYVRPNFQSLVGNDTIISTAGELYILLPVPAYSMDGVWYDGRLAGVFTGNGYSLDWQEAFGWEVPNLSPFHKHSRVITNQVPRYDIPSFKIAVNIVVFALMQPDGMT